MVSRLNLRMQMQKIVHFIVNVVDKLYVHEGYLNEDEREEVSKKLCIIEGIILDVGDIMGSDDEDSEYVEEDIN